VFLLYINKFNTNLGRICFYFSGVLGGITMALKESSTRVSCLHKQTFFIPLLVGLYSSHFSFRTNIVLN